MYTTVLLVHSWWRWVVLLLGVALLVVSLRGWRGAVEWGDRAEKLRKGFLAVLDMQLLLGLVLYLALSPLTRSVMADIGSALGDPVLRFYSIEHAFGMLMGLAAAHIASVRAKRAGAARYRTIFVGQLLWLLFTLGSVPWPGLPYGRPFFRL